MFSKKKKAWKAIRAGNLEGLKRLVEKDPSLLDNVWEWEFNESGKKLDFLGTTLHAAAFFNQPAIVEYLVEDRGAAVERLVGNNKWTPLHHAARAGARLAVEALLKLHANPCAKTRQGGTPISLSNDTEVKRLVQSYIDKDQAQKDEAEKQKEAAARKEKTGGIEGAWTISAPDEITHARELPGGRYSLTQVFNFAAETLTTITENLTNGSIVPETKSFAEVPGQKKLIDEARAQLAEITGVAAPREVELAVKKQPHEYAVMGAKL